MSDEKTAWVRHFVETTGCSHEMGDMLAKIDREVNECLQKYIGQNNTADLRYMMASDVAKVWQKAAEEEVSGS